MLAKNRSQASLMTVLPRRSVTLRLATPAIVNAHRRSPIRGTRLFSPRSDLAKARCEEAAARRAERKPGGPTRAQSPRRRYGDWEVKGLASDFQSASQFDRNLSCAQVAKSVRGQLCARAGRPAPLAFDGLCGLAAASIPAMNLRMRGAISLRKREPLKTP